MKLNPSYLLYMFEPYVYLALVRKNKPLAGNDLYSVKSIADPFVDCIIYAVQIKYFE